MDYHKLRRDKTVQREISFLFAQNWSAGFCRRDGSAPGTEIHCPFYGLNFGIEAKCILWLIGIIRSALTSSI
jgi:hypothetical protein